MKNSAQENGAFYKAGFTLLEMLISLSLLALIFTFLTGTLTFGKRVWETTNQQNENATIPVVQDFLRQKIQQTLPVLRRGNTESIALSFEGKKQSLQFIAPMNAQTVKAGLYQFSLYKEGGNLSLRLTLFRPNQQTENSTPSSYERVLLPKIKKIELQYFGKKAASEKAKWHEDWQGIEASPELVKLNIILPKNDFRRWPNLIIAPRLSF